LVQSPIIEQHVQKDYASD